LIISSLVSHLLFVLLFLPFCLLSWLLFFIYL
jgi:hypothetical protein